MKFAELASEVQIQIALPTQKKEELGLPTGRRRANIAIREAKKRLQDEGEDVKVIFIIC